MPLWVQWFSFLLAVVGSCSGLYALKLNHQRTVIINRNETERLDAKKKAKFSIDCGKEATRKSTQDIFYLQNFGESEARNVILKFYRRIENSDDKKEVFPIYGEIPKTINSGQKVKAVLVLPGGMGANYEVIVKWEDDFKADNELKESLS